MHLFLSFTSSLRHTVKSKGTSMNSCTICTFPSYLKTSRIRGTGIEVCLAMNSFVTASVRRTSWPYLMKLRWAGRESTFNRGNIALIILLQRRRSNARFSSPWSSRTGGVRCNRGSLVTEGELLESKREVNQPSVVCLSQRCSDHDRKGWINFDYEAS